MSRRGVGNRKRNVADDVAEAERRKRRDKAWHLRVHEHLSTRQIAEKLGVDHTTIADDLKKAREEYKPADAEELAAFVRTELYAALAGLRAAVATGDPQSINAQVKALDLFCKLHGLHAPEKLQVEAAATVSVDSARAAMAAAFGSKVLPEPGKPE